jgi:hypothetical protein
LFWRKNGISVTFVENQVNMIQRIQTIFLLLNDVVFVTLFFVPLMAMGGAKGPQFAQELTLTDYPIALVGEILIVVLAGFAMAMFKNRKLQMRLCTIGVIVSLLVSGALLATPYSLNAETYVDQRVYTTGIGTYLSFAHVVMFILARIFIKRDEDLVNSMDRLR